MLNLRDTKRRIVGSISIQLETESSADLNPTDVRKGFTRLQSSAQKAKLDKSGKLEESSVVQMTEAAYNTSVEISPDGLDQLKGALVRLGKLVESFNLDLVVAGMDEVSKVHSPTNLWHRFKSYTDSLYRFTLLLRLPGRLSHLSIKSVFPTKMIVRLLFSDTLVDL